jgi:hypothetical protein
VVGINRIQGATAVRRVEKEVVPRPAGGEERGAGRVGTGVGDDVDD